MSVLFRKKLDKSGFFYDDLWEVRSRKLVFFQEVLMNPTIRDIRVIATCPAGINLGGLGLYLTTDDLAKFAQLILQHGRWGSRQILPADYLKEGLRLLKNPSSYSFHLI